ncbi:COX15/CtaA family protein [Pelagibacteraceae bacterium]|nr:COX15/CtaA family protein [Pelagibacteraceae bacterium]MDC0938005.1 COX15/CtaA family protein [Pelagibacteraceae bacterium]
MIAHEKKIKNLFLYWLFLSLFLVFSIIIVGGLTRLTNSGLSITEWELFKGILPPLNQSSWELYFNQYKKIPQFKLLNYDMNISEFKIIFYWEYFHRILARIIGLFFLIPLIFFYLSKKINIKYINTCFIILSLIILQGLVGWYMVESGLINNVTVSHYRLSMHLSIAFIIITTIFWLIMNINKKKTKKFFNFSKKNIPFLILIFLIFIQIIIGAFVSGLDAGMIYQTWPLMGSTYFPNDIFLKDLKNFLDFNNHSMVQFYHRNLAYLITFYILGLGIFIYKKNLINLFIPFKLVFSFLLLQVILGVLTLLTGLNIYMASAHQISSVILVFSAINLYYYRTK